MRTLLFVLLVTVTTACTQEPTPTYAPVQELCGKMPEWAILSDKYKVGGAHTVEVDKETFDRLVNWSWCANSLEDR